MVKLNQEPSPVNKTKAIRGTLEREYRRLGLRLVGIDEVGRGCLAGPVYAAAVVINYAALEALDTKARSLIRDSKTLSSDQRQRILPVLYRVCEEWALGHSTVVEIETRGIVPATFTAMTRAVACLQKACDLVLIDGNQINPDLAMQQKAIVGGDGLCFAIAAASILAKEARDDYMRQMALEYPAYGFHENVGYGTKSHLTALANHGITPLHRRNFAPIQRYAEQGHIANQSLSAL